MNEDLYLQRLKSIREKYTSANKAPLEIKNTDFAYRPYAINPEYSVPKQKIELTPTRPRPVQADRPVQPEFIRAPPSRVERSYSLADHHPISSTPEPPAYDPSQKRMDNFSAFIRDLDQRIQEKERTLSSKIKVNEVAKPREDPQYQIARTLNRYSSSKDIYRAGNPQLPESVSRVVPREAYERSLAKREEIESRRGLTNHDIQNMLERKWVQESTPNSQKLKAMNGYRGERLKINQYTSPLGISKQENVSLQDNWSIGKLDNIQKRIKAVLG